MSVDESSPASWLNQFSQFVVAMLLLDFVVVGLYAVIGPPDPLSQALVAGAGLLLAPAAAFWLVYRDGWDRLKREITGG